MALVLSPWAVFLFPEKVSGLFWWLITVWTNNLRLQACVQSNNPSEISQLAFVFESFVIIIFDWRSPWSLLHSTRNLRKDEFLMCSMENAISCSGPVNRMSDTSFASASVLLLPAMQCLGCLFILLEDAICLCYFSIFQLFPSLVHSEPRIFLKIVYELILRFKTIYLPYLGP